MVVAALVTTVVFSVAFTIPGGYNQNDGLPIFQKDGPFIMFVILDAISLILSSSSILMFLSILTSRYTQEDFLVSLPKKLMIGLTTLFLSIITMMVAFSFSFFVLYRNKLISIPIIISVGAVVPVFLYMKLQFPLLVDAYRSTYSSNKALGTSTNPKRSKFVRITDPISPSKAPTGNTPTPNPIKNKLLNIIRDPRKIKSDDKNEDVSGLPTSPTSTPPPPRL
ncbi:hypothetical protein OSB04_014021 [Centaurea solstitialis]|uniref:PGG domain-containing protein n=1 Tax=Centaurea solstitialis TaxID=347529 RepID=A0AA38TXD7_9ASTR|nr:hypothetical protein OSB04_014021 [Centaurea solstitialis]